VTPLQTDTTHHGALATLKGWEAALGNGHNGSGPGAMLPDVGKGDPSVID
jgi:hypothetical protein